jgi:CubicO group peptidase (beta-lactamase class C family)
MTGAQVPPPRLDVTYQAVPGHRTARYAAVSELLLSALEAGVPPAAAMQVSAPGGDLSYAAGGGWASLGDESARPDPANSGTLFDIASLTKVVATVPLALLLHQRGKWRLDEPIARWLLTATLASCCSPTAFTQSATSTRLPRSEPPSTEPSSEPPAVSRLLARHSVS